MYVDREYRRKCSLKLFVALSKFQVCWAQTWTLWKFCATSRAGGFTVNTDATPALSSSFTVNTDAVPALNYSFTVNTEAVPVLSYSFTVNTEAVPVLSYSFIVNTDAVAALGYRFNSGQVGYSGYLIII